MARGPFQGTYNPNVRPTVVTAPDAIVYINGETDIIGCASCHRRFDLGKYITQIQTNLDVDSVPGSASISLNIPRHVVDDFYVDGTPILAPMMEVEIFAKGYYTLEGIPQYYPIFWGLITEVSESYSSGEHTVSINCADILKWWDICRMNINPAFTAPSGQLGTSIFANVLFGTNPYDMIFTLAQMSFGDVILGTGSLVSLTVEDGQKATFNSALSDIMQYWSMRFARMRNNLLLYGVSGIAVRGDSVTHALDSGHGGKTSISNAVRNANGGPDAAQLAFDPSDPDVTAFRTQFSQAGEVNFWQAEYQTKLEIANACKEAIGFEFYMDVTGDIVFKPPFYNLDIISNKPVSWIQNIDIIDYNFSESEAEVFTQLTLQGCFGGNTDYGMGPEITPFTSVTDYHLLRRYGWRPHTYNSEFMGDTVRMFYHGMDILDRLNSKRHQGSVTVPMRPELRLGFPIYFAPKDQIWYVRGISHNITFGGRATTSLTLTAKREKFVAIKGISTLKTKGTAADNAYIKAKAEYDKLTSDQKSKKTAPVAPPNSGKAKGPPEVRQLRDHYFDLVLGDAATVPPVGTDPEKPETLEPYTPLVLRHPKTGKLVGYPNVVMVYTRPYDGTNAFDTLAGQKAKASKQVPKASQAQVNQRKSEAKEKIQGVYQFTSTQVLRDKYVNNRFSYGLNSAGVYVYAHDLDKSINQLALLPSANVAIIGDASFLKNTGGGPKLSSPSTMVRPVSDERGFEVIGHFRYGRGVSLRDGSLIYNENETNKRTTPAVQTALTGDLFASLTAQSQGITSVVSAYPNPVDAIARMVVEDSQTAGTWSTDPEGKTSYQFTSVGTDGTNFVDSAPLGSPQANGMPSSVEAGQLSRALTLAEMSVRADLSQGDPKCSCQSSSSDLAFINVGYAVVNITASGGAKNLYDEVPSDAALGTDTNHTLGTRFGYFSSEGGSESSGLQQSLDSPILSTSNRLEDVVQKVDKYLWNLYSALDTPHQDFENALRGNPTGADMSNVTSNPVPEDPQSLLQAQSNFAPPFNSPNRAALGDPLATALQGSSAATNLKDSFSKFSTSLQNSTKASTLSQEIAILTKKLSDLQTSLSASTPTTTQVAPTIAKDSKGNPIIDLSNMHIDAKGNLVRNQPAGTPSVNTTDLEQQIASVQQQISAKQLELASLRST